SANERSKFWLGVARVCARLSAANRAEAPAKKTNERSGNMNLDEAQRKKVAEWIAQGLQLSEIQNRLGSELGLRLTYMEVRLLVDDLKLTPKDVERPKAPQSPLAAPSAA